jgi:uncharacterized protein involved in exopolysaccharide biosynthesis
MHTRAIECTGYLRAAIEVRRERGDVFEITVSDFEAGRARRLAEAVANQFVAASKAAQLDAARSTQSFSAEQEQVYRRKLAESEARLEAASRAALSGSPTHVDASNVVRARGLLEEANLEIEEQRQKLAGLQSQVQDRQLSADLGAVSSPRAATLAAQLAELDRQYSAVLVAASVDNDGSGVRVLIARKYGELEAELEQDAAAALPGRPADARDLVVRTDRKSVV